MHHYITGLGDSPDRLNLRCEDNVKTMFECVADVCQTLQDNLRRHFKNMQYARFSQRPVHIKSDSVPVLIFQQLF